MPVVALPVFTHSNYAHMCQCISAFSFPGCQKRSPHRTTKLFVFNFTSRLLTSVLVTFNATFQRRSPSRCISTFASPYCSQPGRYIVHWSSSRYHDAERLNSNHFMLSNTSFMAQAVRRAAEDILTFLAPVGLLLLASGICI